MWIYNPSHQRTPQKKVLKKIRGKLRLIHKLTKNLSPLRSISKGNYHYEIFHSEICPKDTLMPSARIDKLNRMSKKSQRQRRFQTFKAGIIHLEVWKINLILMYIPRNMSERTKLILAR
jgi:hypothetical protein